MIKLIASDMDGSLLNDSKQLPEDFFAILDELERRGIKFTVASGRTYDALTHLFPEEYLNKLDFICDNGANVIHEGRNVSFTPLGRDTFEQLVKACGDIEGLRVLVCASKGTYHLDTDPDFNKEIARFYKNHFPCKNLLDVDDTIYKLAVWDGRGTQQHAKPAIDAIFGDKLNVQVSGPFWMDVMAAGVSKGSALRTLGNVLGISPEDTMAFGDYYNDMDMLHYARWSFAMENGSPDVKKAARFLARSNNDCGVTRAIKQYVLQEQMV